jgi:predicted ArsR family transcriptional regulator
MDAPAAVQLDLMALAVPAYSCGTAAGHARGSDTSEAAARHIAPTLGARQAAVLDALRALRTATGEQVAAWLARPTYTILPRLTELAAMGLVADTGARRLNASGRSAAVYRLTPAGGLRVVSTGIPLPKTSEAA